MSQDHGAAKTSEGGAGGFRCDFCGEESPRVRRIALAPDYDRLLKPHRVKYACPACSEKKERELSAGR